MLAGGQTPDGSKEKEPPEQQLGGFVNKSPFPQENSCPTSSCTLSFSFSGRTRHCLICNVGFIGGNNGGGDVEDDPYGFYLTGEDVKVFCKLFLLDLDDDEKKSLTGMETGVGQPPYLTSFMTSTNSYCVSCSFKVGILRQLWAELEGIQVKICWIRGEFLQNIRKAFPQIPQGCSAHTIKLKVLDKTFGAHRVVVKDKEPAHAETMPSEVEKASCGAGEGSVMNPNTLVPASGDLVEPNNLEGLNPDPEQRHQYAQLNPSSAQVDIKMCDGMDKHEPTLPPSPLRASSILDNSMNDDSDEGQVKSSEGQDLSQQTLQKSKSETQPKIEKHEIRPETRCEKKTRAVKLPRPSTYTENNIGSILTCPEVEKCNSKGFGSLELLRRHFTKEHLRSKKNVIIYRGNVQALTCKCKLCPPSKKGFARFRDLKYHMKTVHKGTTKAGHLQSSEDEDLDSDHRNQSDHNLSRALSVKYSTPAFR